MIMLMYITEHNIMQNISSLHNTNAERKTTG